MKTIEERAKEYADLCVVGDCSGLSGLIHSVAAKAYFAGCHEQKVIDDMECETMVGYAAKECKQVLIDKACEWLKAHYKVIYWEVESPTRRGDIGEYLAEDFRTAMEEEL